MPVSFICESEMDSVVWNSCMRVFLVMSDERDIRRSVNKPMTGSEMDSVVWNSCMRVLLVMSDERDVRRSVNKPMTGSEMDSVVWNSCMRVFLVMSDERDIRRSVNKPMTGSEMEQQLLKHLQHECNVGQRRPMTSRERAYSDSSETMSTQPLGAFTYYYVPSTHWIKYSYYQSFSQSVHPFIRAALIAELWPITR